MVAGETILKVSDFPFSYSILGILLVGLWGMSLQNEGMVILLGTAGALGSQRKKKTK